MKLFQSHVPSREFGELTQINSGQLFFDLSTIITYFYHIIKLTEFITSSQFNDLTLKFLLIF